MISCDNLLLKVEFNYNYCPVVATKLMPTFVAVINDE